MEMKLFILLWAIAACAFVAVSAADRDDSGTNTLLRLPKNRAFASRLETKTLKGQTNPAPIAPFLPRKAPVQAFKGPVQRTTAAAQSPNVSRFKASVQRPTVAAQRPTAAVKSAKAPVHSVNTPAHRPKVPANHVNAPAHRFTPQPRNAPAHWTAQRSAPQLVKPPVQRSAAFAQTLQRFNSPSKFVKAPVPRPFTPSGVLSKTHVRSFTPSGVFNNPPFRLSDVTAQLSKVADIAQTGLAVAQQFSSLRSGGTAVDPSDTYDDGSGMMAGPDDGSGMMAGPDDGSGMMAGPEDGSGTMICDPAGLGCNTGEACNNCQCCRGFTGGCWKPNTPLTSFSSEYRC
jgi:hypothetical protein